MRKGTIPFILGVILFISLFSFGKADDFESPTRQYSNDTIMNDNVKLSNSSIDISNPRISVGENGLLISSWTYYSWPDHPFSDTYFRISNNYGATFEDQVDLNHGEDFGQGSMMTKFDCNNTMYSIWKESNGLNFARSIDRGSVFSDKININNTYPLGFVHLACYIAVFNEFIYILFTGPEAVTYLSVSNDSGSSFSDPMPIGAFYYVCSMQVDHHGTLFLLNQEENNSLSLIRSFDHGRNFTGPIIITRPEEYTTHGNIAIDNKGIIHVVWIDRISDLTSYSRSIDGGQHFSNSIVLENSSTWNPQSLVGICTDDWGGVYVVWSDSDSGNNDVYLSYSLDNGNTFSKKIRVNDDTGTASQIEPDIGCDELGNVYVVWKDDRNGMNDTYFSKLEALDHPPRSSTPLPTRIDYYEDTSSGEPTITLSDYFEDDGTFENLRIEVVDERNSSFFEPRITDDRLAFDQMMSDLNGVFRYRLKVRDQGADGMWDTDDDNVMEDIPIILYVIPMNDPPRIEHLGETTVDSDILNITVPEDSWFNATLFYSEVDGERCEVEIAPKINNFIFNVSSLEMSYHPTNIDVGTHEITINVTDRNLSMDEIKIIFNVTNTNDPPTVKVGKQDRTMYEDEAVKGISFANWFSDIDGDELDFSGRSTSNITLVIEGEKKFGLVPTANWSGRDEVEVRATDGYVTVSVSIDVLVRPVNDPPYDPIIILLQEEYFEGKEQLVKGNASDIDDGVLYYLWYEGAEELGSGEQLDLGLKAGEHMITLRVMDGSGNTTQTMVTIQVSEDRNEGGPKLLILMIIVIILIFVLTGILSIVLIVKRTKKKKEPIQETGPESAIDTEKETSPQKTNEGPIATEDPNRPSAPSG